MKLLFETGLELAESSRPQHSATAAFLLHFLVQLPVLHDVITQQRSDVITQQRSDVSTQQRSDVSTQRSYVSTQQRSDVITQLPNTPSCRSLLALSVLLRILEQQLVVASRSLMDAAASKPLYPTLHAINHLLGAVDFRSVNITSMQTSVLSY